MVDLKEDIHERMLSLTKESERNQELVTELQERQEILEMAVEDLEQESKPWRVRLTEWVLELMICTFEVFFALLKGFRTEILFMFLFSVFCAVLDPDTLIKDGKFKFMDCIYLSLYFNAFIEFLTQRRSHLLSLGNLIPMYD